jgi:hypothetical protein
VFPKTCRVKFKHATSIVMELRSLHFIYMTNCTVFVSFETDYGEVATWFGQVNASL